MAGYTININVGGGSGSGNGTGSSNLEAAGLGAVVGSQINGMSPADQAFQSKITNKFEKKMANKYSGFAADPDSETMAFITSKTKIGGLLKTRTIAGYEAGLHTESVSDSGETRDSYNTLGKGHGIMSEPNAKGTAFAGALAVKTASAVISNTVKWNAATATSTAQKQAINNYNNAMTGVGFATRGAGYIYAGMAIGGPVGGAVGFAVNAGVTAMGLTADNNIRQYEQKVNRISSSNQMAMLGDATYGRSRGGK